MTMKNVAALKNARILGAKAAESTPTEDQLRLINQFTRRDLSADEVYIYPILLCDNEIDRDQEYFEDVDLELLAALAPGVTGILDHTWSARNQQARLFAAEVVRETRGNRRGVPYSFLKGWAYILNTDKYAGLISDIDGGILKEVSIGFSYATPRCSICGGDYRRYDECEHIRGRQYEKEICYVRMADPREMYEWSHVAVPAQPAAGALKSLGMNEDLLLTTQVAEKEQKATESKPREKSPGDQGEEEYVKLAEALKTLGVEAKDETHAIELIKGLQAEAAKVPGLQSDLETKTKMANYGEEYLAHLKAEAIRLGGIVDKTFNAEVMKSVYDKCSPEELKAFNDQYQKKLDEMFPPVTQSQSGGGAVQSKSKPINNDVYKV